MSLTWLSFVLVKASCYAICYNQVTSANQIQITFVPNSVTRFGKIVPNSVTRLVKIVPLCKNSKDFEIFMLLGNFL